MKSIVERLLVLPSCEDPNEILNAAITGAHEIRSLQVAAYLRRKADQRAIEAWHKAHPEKAHLPPNNEDVVMWLMEQHDQFETRMENDRAERLAESADELAQALKWRETINNRLTSWMAPIKDGEEPHDALLRLLEFEQRAFNDPAVSDSAAYLVAETKRDALREAADLCDQLSEHTPGICAIAIREMADEVERDCP
jgi:hypothetical protein